MRASSYTTLFRVSLRGVGPRCVGMAQKITRVPMFSTFSLFVFLFSSLYHSTCTFFLFPQRVPSDLEVGDEKSILTRTETFSITTCFKEPLLFITLFLKRKCFIGYLFPLEHETRY